jgi:hypothetical protein
MSLLLAVMTASTTRPRWWQWPTVLSLDAPAVVIAWQWLVARALLFPLGGRHAIVLGASTWLAYSADRWIEGCRLAPDVVQTTRHFFYQRHRLAIALVWLAVLTLDLLLSFTALTSRELTTGALLLLAVMLYLLSHQLAHRHLRWRVPKEIVVALILVAGVGLFPLADEKGVWPLLGYALADVALLFFCNLALIAAWERNVDTAHGQTSIALQFRHLARWTRALPWSVALLALLACGFASVTLRPIFACTAASAILLGLIDLGHYRGRLHWRVARVLADAALLTPVALALAQFRA